MIKSIIVLLFAIISFNYKSNKLVIPTDKTLINEGKRIYMGTCVACHNSNPHKPGSIGPDLYSTPKEVFYTKVPEGKYPDGYKPKRKTRVMPKFKHLTNKIDMIYNYIRSVPK